MNLIRWKVISSAVMIVVVTCLAVAATGGSARPTAGTQTAAVEPERISAAELIARLAKDDNIVIVDVRGKDYDSSDKRIKGAMRIPPAEFKSHISHLSLDKEIVTYCACGDDGGAIKAAQTLLENGFKNVKVLKGGWNGWVQAGGAVETK
jgi:rhodanese-related sulfurtransferase